MSPAKLPNFRTTRRPSGALTISVDLPADIVKTLHDQLFVVNSLNVTISMTGTPDGINFTHEVAIVKQSTGLVTASNFNQGDIQ